MSQETVNVRIPRKLWDWAAKVAERYHHDGAARYSIRCSRMSATAVIEAAIRDGIGPVADKLKTAGDAPALPEVYPARLPPRRCRACQATTADGCRPGARVRVGETDDETTPTEYFCAGCLEVGEHLRD